MELQDFLTQTQNDVHREIAERTGQPGPFPYPVSIFSEIVMEHMANASITTDPRVLHVERKFGSANLRLSGYAISEAADQLDLFVAIYSGTDKLEFIADSEITATAQRSARKWVPGTADWRIQPSLAPSALKQGATSRRRPAPWAET